MSMVIARILLRYGAAALITRGLLAQDVGGSIASDPDIQMLLGMAIGAAAEGWYYIARRRGWER